MTEPFFVRHNVVSRAYSTIPGDVSRPHEDEAFVTPCHGYPHALPGLHSCCPADRKRLHQAERWTTTIDHPFESWSLAKPTPKNTARLVRYPFPGDDRKTSRRAGDRRDR